LFSAFLGCYQGWDVVPDRFCIGAIRSALIALAFRVFGLTNADGRNQNVSRKGAKAQREIFLFFVTVAQE
jgi:hypothetical protein